MAAPAGVDAQARDGPAASAGYAPLKRPSAPEVAPPVAATAGENGRASAAAAPEPAAPTVLKRPSAQAAPQDEPQAPAVAGGETGPSGYVVAERETVVLKRPSTSTKPAPGTAEAALEALAPSLPPAADGEGPSSGARQSRTGSLISGTTSGTEDWATEPWLGPQGPLVDKDATYLSLLPASDHVTGTLDEIAQSIMNDIDLNKDKEHVRIQGFRGEDDLNHYTIFSNISMDRKAALIRLAAQDVGLSRAMGSMCGMGVGDALGHPFEFLPAQDAPTPSSPHFDLKAMRFVEESNAFMLDRGQWTDDAAMGLCMADTFICRRQFDGSDMRTRFWCWWNRGYNNAFRNDPRRTSSVGLGGNISKSLMALTRLRAGQTIPPAYEATTEDAGNGSLMRFTPVAIFLHNAGWETIHDVARASSYTTHPGIIAAEACSFLAHLIVSALRLPAGVPDVPRWLEKTADEYMEISGLKNKSGWGYDQMKWLVTGSPVNMTERCWKWRDENLDIAGTLEARGFRYNGYPVSSGYFGSYSLDGLAMALWSIYHTKSFDEAITRSVNLLGDADSHGSITGQLAGALYGLDAINPQFMHWMAPWDDHEFALRAVLLHKIGAAVGASAPL